MTNCAYQASKDEEGNKKGRDMPKKIEKALHAESYNSKNNTHSKLPGLSFFLSAGYQEALL